MVDKREAFSNRDRNVFLITADRGIDRGALISRYSRTASLDIREVYDKEFAANSERGSEFYRRVFSDYGDESVAELVFAQVGVQGVSNIVSKMMEDLRIGLSFIEKSSRYVRYDKKVNGRYLFLSAEEAGINGNLQTEYDDLCRDLFIFYSECYGQVTGYFEKTNPIENCAFANRKDSSESLYSDLSGNEKELAQKAYSSAIRARALDDLRYILPASTLTNLGISGNARGFIHLVSKMKATGLTEALKLADDIYNELLPEFPEIINAATSDYGRSNIDYIRERESFRSDPQSIKHETVELISFNTEEEELKKIGLAYSIKTGSTVQNRDDVISFINKQAEMRKNRRNKPSREFEIPVYQFLISTNYGAFRDLQRHRMMTIIRGFLNPKSGYDTPVSIRNDEKLLSDFALLMKRAAVLWEKISVKNGYEIAQYVIPYAYRYPIYVSVNLKEACYLTELRSTPQAHFDLRKISVSIYDSIKSVHPNLSNIIRFVDKADYPLGRIFAEFRKEKKTA
jgi:thymidylate synthase ThyX